MGRKSVPAIIFVCLLLAGCTKGGDDPVPPPSGAGKKAYVVCEGSLGNGNSALSLYFPDKDSVYQDVYKAINGMDLGDIFQSMLLIGDQYFLCINNSDRIIIINKNTWKLEGQINVPKPRYILPVSSTKAYVSSLFSDKVYLINPQTATSYGAITLPYQNAEGMFLYGNKVYVASWDTACRSLTTIDISNDQIGTPVTGIGAAPQEILMDKEQKLWVLSGNVYKGKAARLTRIDPATGSVLKTYAFSSAADPARPVFNAAKDTLYFIEVNYSGGTADNGIYRMSVADAALPSQAFIPARQLQYFWALGIEPGTGHIYVGDPKGFTQRGQVYIYRQDGTAVTDFKVGVGPGHFCFEQ